MTLPRPAFLRVAGSLSAASAVTTLLLIFLPDLIVRAPGFEGRMTAVTDPAYRLRAVVYLVHPFLVFTAMLATALAIRRQAALALVGLLGFALWAATEAAQQCWTLFAFDRWRLAWLAGDAEVRATMPVRTAIYDGIWDAAYPLLLIGFLIGCTCFAAALMRWNGLARVVGAFFAGAALLTLGNLAGEWIGWTWPPPLDRWLYPTIQPLGRLLTGIWLFRLAREWRTTRRV